jgi:hypothetical protein
VHERVTGGADQRPYECRLATRADGEQVGAALLGQLDEAIHDRPLGDDRLRRNAVVRRRHERALGELLRFLVQFGVHHRVRGTLEEMGDDHLAVQALRKPQRDVQRRPRAGPAVVPDDHCERHRHAPLCRATVPASDSYPRGGGFSAVVR